MSKCNAETCKFFDFCKFSEDNFDPASCVIGAEISRRVRAEINEQYKMTAGSEPKTETKPATTKKGGAKK